MIFKSTGSGIATPFGGEVEPFKFDPTFLNDLEKSKEELGDIKKAFDKLGESGVEMTKETRLQVLRDSFPKVSSEIRDYAVSTEFAEKGVRGFVVQEEQKQLALAAGDKSFRNVSSLIKTYNTGLEECTSNHQEFADGVLAGNTVLGKYLKTTESGKASMGGYILRLAGATAKTIGLRVATMALNGAISLAVSALISFAITKFKEWGQESQKAAERVKKAAESADELSESFKSLDEYRDKIIAIRDALDDGNLSEDEAREKRKELLSIQDELIEKYGDEKTAIDKITDAIRGQADALEELKRAKADQWLRESQDDIAAAQKFFSEKGDYYIDLKESFGGNANDKVDKLLMEFWAAHNDSMSVVSASNTSKQGVLFSNPSVNFNVHGTRDEVLAVYDDIYDLLQKEIKDGSYSEEEIARLQKVLQGVSEAKKYITRGKDDSGDYENHKKVLATASENAVLDNKELSILYKEYLDNIDLFNDAVISDSQETVDDAYSKVKESYNALISGVKSDLGNVSKSTVRNWMKDVQSEFEQKNKDYDLRYKVRLRLDPQLDKQALSSLAGGVSSPPQNIVQTVLWDTADDTVRNWMKDPQLDKQALSSLAGGVFSPLQNIAQKAISDTADDTLQKTVSLLAGKQFSFEDIIDYKNKIATGYAINPSGGMANALVNAVTNSNGNSISDVFRYIEKSADELGISFESLLEVLNELGYVQKETKDNADKFSVKKYSTEFDALTKKISTLKTAYDKVLSGEFTLEDKLKLITDKDYDFSSLQYIEDVGAGIRQLADKDIDSLLGKLSEVKITALGEEELGSYNTFIEYLVELKTGFYGVSASQEKLQKDLSNSYSLLKSLVSMRNEITSNGKLSQESVNSILGDEKYKQLWDSVRNNNVEEYTKAIDSMLKSQQAYYNDSARALLDNYLGNSVTAVEDQIKAFEKQYNIDLSNWNSTLDDKAYKFDKSVAEQLSKQKKLINDFKTIYLTDLANYSSVMEAKKDIFYNFRKTRIFKDVEQSLRKYTSYDAESGRIKLNLWGDGSLGGLAASFANENVRSAMSELESIGWTLADYEKFLNDEMPDILSDKLSSAFGMEWQSTLSSSFSSIANTVANSLSTFDINQYSSGNEKNGSSTSATKQFFDWIERRLKKLANDTKQTFAKVADYISFTGKNNQLSKAISSLMNEAQANQEAYNKYMSYANGVQLDDYYKWQVRNGSMQIDQIQDANLQEAINKYKEYYDAAMSCADAVEDLKKQEKEYGEQMLSNIEKYFNNRIQYAASSADYYNSLDTSNLYRSKNFDEIRKSYKKQIAETQNEASNLRATLNSLISWRLVKEGDDVWYEWRDKIDKCDLSVRNLQKSVRDLANEELKVIQSDFENKINSSQNAVSKINAFAGDDTRNAKKDYAGLTREYNSQISYTSQMVDKLRKRLNTAVNNGDIEKYSDTWYEWTGVIEKGEADIIDLKKNVHELSVEQFNDIQKSYEHQLSAFEKTAKTYENKNKELELRGRLSSKKYYEALTQNETQNIKAMEREATALQEQLTKAMLSGNVQAGSEQWYTMRDAIDSVNESIAEGRLTLLEYSKTIREIEWGYFDFLLERISQINGEADFLIDLMSNSKLFSDSGNITSKGRASMGLHVQNYDVYMAQADLYAAEIIKVNRQLANDPNNTEILKRREELLKLQQQSITSAQKEKTAIVDLVKNGIDLQLSSLKKLIEEYTKSLDQAKNLYEYQKNISEKTENIAKIRKQIAAYENDASEETRTKIQQLQVSLKEAEQDLEETEYDKFISDTKELLDDLYEDYEKILNDRLDNIDKLFADMVDVVNGSSSEINATIKSAANDVGYSLSKYITDIWSGQNKVTSDYNANFLSGLTNVNSVLKSIEYYVSRLVDGTVPNGQTGAAASYTTKTSSGSGTSSGGGSVNVAQSSRGGSTGISNNTSVNSSKTSAVTKSSSTSVSSSGKVTTTSTSASNRSMKEMYGVALAIINGNYGWGAGDIRKKNLLAKGFDYDTIQTIVNKIWKDGYIAGADWKGRYYGITDLSAYDIKRYKNGGLVKYTGLAQVDGTPSNPEAFLDAEDTRNISRLVEQMSSLSALPIVKADSYTMFKEMSLQNIRELSDRFADYFKGSRELPTHVENHIEISIDHVDDYNDFVTKLQQDRKFESMVQDMTVGRLSGQSSLSKHRYTW